MGPRHQVIFEDSDEHIDALTLAVRSHYRCPKEFLNFCLAGDLSRSAGFFQFGSNTFCYGRVLEGEHRAKSNSCCSDIFLKASAHSSQVVLPFDPNEVIDNLRLERYPHSQMTKYERLLKSVYYYLRPFTNQSIRICVQKLRASRGQAREFPHWPVDTSVEDICERLLLLAIKAKGLDSIPFVWFWPNGARGCVAMTHDVETALGRDFSGRLMDLDDSFGIKASFQIVPEERYTVTHGYLQDLRARGFEVCVQDMNHDGRLFDNYAEFERRVAKINRYAREYGAKGFRAAVLYRNLDWFQDLDFSFDMTVPNVAHMDPQRGGCCTVMPYFIGDVLELPVTTMQDYTLFHILNERCIEPWKIQLERILAKNGMAMFIVHPDYIVEPETQTVYKALLDTLRDMRKHDSVWFALPSEIDTWWRARSRMSVVQEGGSWRIVGEGSERAVLAFARIVDGQLVYDLSGTSNQELQLCSVDNSHRRIDGSVAKPSETNWRLS